MKALLLISLAMLAVSCSTFHPNQVDANITKAIESAVLWQAELDPTWTPVDMASFVNKRSLFRTEGNFFKPKRKIMVFGHELVYAGMVGYDLWAGPNVILDGTPETIATYIQKAYGLKLTEKDGEYFCNLKEYIDLLIGKNPNTEGQTIVIGSYTGP
jgi:hypothetical protein